MTSVVAADDGIVVDFRDRLKILVLGWACGVITMIMTAVVTVVLIDLGHGTVTTELTASERLRGIVLTEPTAEITVRFASPSEIKQRAPHAIAYSIARADGHGPCEITLPTGMAIRFDPETQDAHFVRQGDTDTVVHELLHCLRLNWHG